MLSLILLQQIAQLFIIIFLGWAIVKAGILKSEDSRVLSMLLLYVIIPCVILNAFQIERTTDTVRMMELSLLSALMMNVLSLVLGRLSAKLFCLNTVETASVMYSNCTNMVVPLVIGIFGEDWVMYVTCYSIVQTILVWTHARILISGKKEISLRDLVCNVNILAIAIGLFLFAFQIRLPAVIRSAFAMAGNTMGPVAMLIIGMLMEANAAVVMMTPILLPLLNAFGIDLLQFGIVMSFNLCIGLVTPPVGLCLLLCNQTGETRLSHSLKAMMPMLLISIIVLFLITYVSPLTTLLPSIMAG